jgi:hypothetical protein
MISSLNPKEKRKFVVLEGQDTLGKTPKCAISIPMKTVSSNTL